MRRRQLKRVVSLMFAVMGLLFLYVLFAGLGTQNPYNATGESEILLTVLPGQTVLRRVNGQRVWVSRISEQQQTKLGENNPDLNEQSSSCDKAEVCVLSANAAKNGLDIVFSKAQPPQLSSDVLWNGGFVDPTSGAVFDLLGRPYRLNKPSDAQRMRAL